jgi:hypothetical protein
VTFDDAIGYCGYCGWKYADIKVACYNEKPLVDKVISKE